MAGCPHTLVRGAGSVFVQPGGLEGDKLARDSFAAQQRIGANSRQLARTELPSLDPAPEMFSSFSPSAEAHRLVISHRLNLTIRPVEHTASSRRFADCSAGVLHPSRQVCCNATCGLCGGRGCSSRPGGPRQCCMPPILRTGRVCESRADVACSLRDSSNDTRGGQPTPPADSPTPRPLVVYVAYFGVLLVLAHAAFCRTGGTLATECPAPRALASDAAQQLRTKYRTRAPS